MNYLIAAYSAIWILLFLYLFSLAARLKNLEKTLEAVKRRIGEKSSV
jgi:CcmD family protein